MTVYNDMWLMGRLGKYAGDVLSIADDTATFAKWIIASRRAQGAQLHFSSAAIGSSNTMSI